MVPTGPLSAVATYLAADMCLTSDPVVARSIQVWSHTFVVIDHEIVSTLILLLLSEGLLKVTLYTKYRLTA